MTAPLYALRCRHCDAPVRCDVCGEVLDANSETVEQGTGHSGACAKHDDSIITCSARCVERFYRGPSLHLIEGGAA